MNTTKAIIRKSIIFAIKSPYENVDFPIVNYTSFKSLSLGNANPINGVITSVTMAVTSFHDP